MKRSLKSLELENGMLRAFILEIANELYDNKKFNLTSFSVKIKDTSWRIDSSHKVLLEDLIIDFERIFQSKNNLN